MADNFDFTPGTGATGSAEDEGGILYPNIKLTASGTGTTEALSKAEDSAHASGNHGIMALTVRQDTAASLSGTDADYQPLITDANGRLHVLDQNSAAILTAVQIMDDWDDGDKCKVIIQTGSNAIGKLAANTGVDIGDVDVTSVIAGVGATNLGKARDSALGATDTGVMTLVVRDDTLTTLTPVDGDYVPLRVGSTGKLHVTDANITACNTGAVVISSGTVTTVSTVTNLAQLGGTAITMDEGVHDAGCQRITVATDDDLVAYLATIAGDTTSMDGNITACNTGAVVLSSGTVTTVSTVTAVTSLDKAVYVDDADWTDNTSSHTLVGGVYQSSPHTVTDGDVSPFGVDVNGNIVLGTSAKAIGKLAANTGVDIGDVDVTSIVPGVAATNLGKAEDAGHSTGDVGVMALTVRQDTAANLGDTDADYQPLITDANGRLHVLDENSGAIKTAVEIMDDWDAVHDSAASSDGPQVMAAYDSTKPAVVEDGDAVRMLADQYGRLLVGVEPQRFQAVFDSANASAEGNAVHASAASTIIVVQSYIISSDAEIWVKLQEEDSTALTGKFWLKAGGGVAITLPKNAPIVLGVDSDLEVITEGAGNVSVSITGYTIPG